MPYLFEDLKVSSYFSGIGAFEVALDRLFADINSSSNETESFGGEK
jgi:DNA (cytosine-5)-methyltransferase 1